MEFDSYEVWPQGEYPTRTWNVTFRYYGKDDKGEFFLQRTFNGVEWREQKDYL